MTDPESFSAMLQRSLDKQAAKRDKNRRLYAATVAEIKARKAAQGEEAQSSTQGGICLGELVK